MPAYSEEEIIAGCRKKNRTFQEHLYKIYYSMFLKVCARYAKDMQDAEQLLNDGFLKIFTQVNNYKSTGSFAGWMRRIMVNTCLDYLKSSYKREAMLTQVSTDATEQTTIAVGNDGLDNIEFKELVAIIQSLPAMTRTVFNLFVFEGYNHHEISTQLEISEGTSHWHVHQARSLLQQKINKIDSQNVKYETK